MSLPSDSITAAANVAPAPTIDVVAAAQATPGSVPPPGATNAVAGTPVVPSSPADVVVTPPVLPPPQPAARIATAAAVSAPSAVSSVSVCDGAARMLDRLHVDRDAAAALLAAVRQLFHFDEGVLVTAQADADRVVERSGLRAALAQNMRAIASDEQLNHLADRRDDKALQYVLSKKERARAILPQVSMSEFVQSEAPTDPAAEARALTFLELNFSSDTTQAWRAAPRAFARVLQTLLSAEEQEQCIAWQKSDDAALAARLVALQEEMTRQLCLTEAYITELAQKLAPFQAVLCNSDLERNPHNLDTLRVRACLAGILQGATDAALQDLAEVFKFGADAEDYVLRSQIYMRAGRPVEAEADLARASAFDMKNELIFKAFQALAYDNAEATLQRDPHNVAALCRRGTLRLLRGEEAEAQADRDAAAALATDNEADLLEELTFNLQLVRDNVRTKTYEVNAQVFEPSQVDLDTAAARFVARVDLATPYRNCMKEAFKERYHFEDEALAATMPYIAALTPDATKLKPAWTKFGADTMARIDTLLASQPLGNVLVEKVLPLLQPVDMKMREWNFIIGSETARPERPPSLAGTPLRCILQLIYPQAAADVGGVYGAQCDTVAYSLRSVLTDADIELLAGAYQNETVRALVDVYRTAVFEYFEATQHDESLRGCKVQGAALQLAQANKALAVDPNNAKALSSRGTAQWVLGMSAADTQRNSLLLKARNDFDLAVNTDSTVQRIIERARCALEMDDLAQVALDAEALVQFAPRNAESFLIRCQLRLAEGQFALAQSDGLHAYALALDEDQRAMAEQLIGEIAQAQSTLLTNAYS